MNLDTMGINFNDSTLNYPQASGMNLIPCVPFGHVPGAADKEFKNMTIAAYGTGATARFFIRSGSESNGDAVWQEIGVTAGGVATVPEGGTGRATLTDHAILVGSGVAPIDFVGPAAAGTILQGAGAAADPAFSTATYPSTTAQGDLLLSASANAITALPKSATATRYIANTGASNNAQWDQVNLSNGVTGVLPQANGGTGSATYFTNGAVETTDATPTTLISLDLGATAGVYTFDIKVAGFANVGAGAPLAIGYTIVGCIRTDGATATFINQAVDSFEEGAMSACVGTLTASGNNAIVQVTGVAAYTIDWVGQLTSIFADATT